MKYWVIQHDLTKQFLHVGIDTASYEPRWTNDHQWARTYRDHESACEAAEKHPGTRVITIIPIGGR